jgi:hypothetical protein
MLQTEAYLYNHKTFIVQATGEEPRVDIIYQQNISLQQLKRLQTHYIFASYKQFLGPIQQNFLRP